MEISAKKARSRLSSLLDREMQAVPWSVIMNDACQSETSVRPDQMDINCLIQSNFWREARG